MTTPSEPRVLITGLALVSEEGWKPADLWLFGDRFIINASGKDWHVSGPHYDKIICVDLNDGSCWERRNVYVVAADRELLNQAALDYIAENARKYGAPSL